MGILDGLRSGVRTIYGKQASKKQIWITWFAVLLVFLMGIYPPWKNVGALEGVKLYWPGGCHWIWYSLQEVKRTTIEIDYQRLFLQWFLVVLPAWTAIWTLKDRSEERKEQSPK